MLEFECSPYLWDCQYPKIEMKPLGVQNVVTTLEGSGITKA